MSDFRRLEVMFIDRTNHLHAMAKGKSDLIVRDICRAPAGALQISLRNPAVANTGNFRLALTDQPTATSTPPSLKMYATTTAYETAQDVGIGSPNVINCVTIRQEFDADAFLQTEYVDWSTPNLHPEGFPVVTDVLIGVAAAGCDLLANDTIELDIMVIAEPVKLTKDDMESMLTQATDL